MPSRLSIDPSFTWVRQAQDDLVTRAQALDRGHTRRSIGQRLANGMWRLVLPDVYLCTSGEPTRRQLMVAALLYAGPNSAIDGMDAARFHGVRAASPPDEFVEVVAPWTDPARSRGFVRLRRTVAPIQRVDTDLLRYLAPAPAVIAAARGLGRERDVLALLSDALQRNVVEYEDLVLAHIQGSPKRAALTDRALAELGEGARSVPEVDFLRLASASLVLPPPICNARLQLPNGRVLSPDALWPDAALIHETNGRSAHARHDLFADMQERHDALTAAGFTVLHNTPRRLRRYGREVVAELERCYERYNGRGMPDGVRVLGLAG